MTGIDGLIYFQSNSSSSGSASIDATFVKGTNADIAQVQVQNKVQQALSRLPAQVQQQGLTVVKSNADFLMVAAVYDETDRMGNLDVSDYLVSNLQDAIGRLPGVGDVNIFGAPYAMRGLARPGEARRGRADPRRRDRRDPGAEHPGRRPGRSAHSPRTRNRCCRQRSRHARD